MRSAGLVFMEKSDDGTIGRLKGICTTDHLDAQGHIVNQDGLMYDTFMESGSVSIEHPVGVLNLIGKPVSMKRVEMDDGHIGHELVTDIYLELPVAKSTYDLSVVLQKHGEGRQLGYSIEGGFKDDWFDKTTSTIMKSLITGCVVTGNPANKNARLSPLMKSVFGIGEIVASGLMGSPKNEARTMIKGIDLILSRFPKLSLADAKTVYGAIRSRL